MDTINVVPQGREFLAFSYDKPADWKAVELPPEEPNYDDPKYFEPVAAAAFEYGTAIFSVGTRMRYAGGTLREWLEHLCGEDNIQIEEIHEFTAGPMRGFRFDARQSDGTTTMIMRNLYVEDGGALFAVCAMAVEQIYSSVAGTLEKMVESFRIASPDGPTVELEPQPWVPFSSPLGFSLSVPADWSTSEEDAAAVLTHGAKGVEIRIERRDTVDLDDLQRDYPDAETIRIDVAGTSGLGVAGVDRGFLLFTAHPAPEGRVFLARTAAIEFPDALSAANAILPGLSAPVLA